jgi:hypothetical protein
LVKNEDGPLYYYNPLNEPWSKEMTTEEILLTSRKILGGWDPNALIGKLKDGVDIEEDEFFHPKLGLSFPLSKKKLLDILTIAL